MGLTLAMTGKGGVGKTTLSALTIDWLVRRGELPVLAVDADSNANLHEALGVSYAASIGGIRESARSQAQAQGLSKQEFLDLRVQQALVERDGYDLIVMGRPEGQGCYCFANNVLREVLQRLTKTYRHIVLDSEAGLEHISRRTLLALDYLLIVSDCTVRGIHTAARISALADEVALPAKARGLIINRVPDGKLPPVVNQAACETGLPLLAIVPLDPQVAALDAGGVPIGNIAPDAPARVCLSAMLEKLLTVH
ncbi:MAG: AAA family ATPase [Candidatus Korobacteraceae bacterium]|jgi:CO dehydrogenase maturation factor